MDGRKIAYLWEKADDNFVQCRLCSFRCRIAPGNRGRCSVRENIDGTLYSLNYNMLCAAGVDPIEKKPLYHSLPGTKSYSIAAPGCSFRCVFCQNWQISQWEAGSLSNCVETDSEKIADSALRSGCRSIAYTYSEPTIFMETAADAAVKAKETGLKNIFVSNGYMTIEALDFASDWLDAANIDLKSFSQKSYKDTTGGDLEPVLNTLRHIAGKTDIHLEITTLIVPDMNDGEEELDSLTKFIAAELSPQIPWHVSAYYPAYKSDGAPTNPRTVLKACEIGRKNGLQYVYPGNIAASSDTKCPDCGEILIERSGYAARILTDRPECPGCGKDIPIIFD
jgi:pyruvate formate lyase activating enzyme